ncbi:MAG: amidohydrolase [Elusimicrobia bacterium]|nr:amidohydrolase [Elusimicrobiota bacterium]
MAPLALLAFLIVTCPRIVLGAELALDEQIQALVDKDYLRLKDYYTDLHGHPELSRQEKRSSENLSRELKEAGFEVTGGIGGYGVVGVLKNGDGPTVLVRTDMDALPVKEETGLSYASVAEVKSEDGALTPVMHACGHDMHQAVFVGVARLLSQLKTDWRGTLVFIGQPAEEIGAGAKAMLKDGLFMQFPKPDFALALHVDSSLAAGAVGYREGWAFANVDSVDITVKGRGGHGAYPENSIDPVVIASRLVVALQTIVSREIKPTEPAVVTVGAIHGGSKHNIIPDEVRLMLTVRSYTDEVRARILDAIKRIALHVAASAGAEGNLTPEVKVLDDEYTPAAYNDSALVLRVVGNFRRIFGAQNVLEKEAVMGGEDFGRYRRAAGGSLQSFMFRLGSADPKADPKQLPSLHSSKYAPVVEPTLKTGVRAMTWAVLTVLGG